MGNNVAGGADQLPLDPCTTLPAELFEHVLLHFSVRDILQFSLVSHSWHEACNSSSLWRHLLCIALYGKGRQRGDEGLVSQTNRIFKMEEDEEGLKLAKMTHPMSADKMNEWKLYYFVKVCFVKVRWMPPWDNADRKYLVVGQDLRDLSLPPKLVRSSSMPTAQIWGSVGFVEGLRRWRFRVEELPSGGYFAVGVSSARDRPFTAKHYVGFSSSGACYALSNSITKGYPTWSIGDVIKVELNSNKSVVTVWRNEDMLGQITITPSIKYWPWVAGFGQGGSITVID